MGKRNSAADRELDAMGVILKAIEGLDGESVQRVLDYVFSRLSIVSGTRPKPSTPVASPQTVQPVELSHRPSTPSIRDLKEEKQPESSSQMAALVAYYLSEVLREDGKDAINASDIEKYFKQAKFKLPKSLPQTLPNASAAGYFDPLGSGQYRLNPVGYNLVVHGLPRGQESKRATRKPSKTTRHRKTKAR
jgi:hypothetical protein